MCLQVTEEVRCVFAGALPHRTREMVGRCHVPGHTHLRLKSQQQDGAKVRIIATITVKEL